MHPEILKRISKIPNSDFVARYTTPVISFGNFQKAKIGTLGINPSSAEFYSKEVLYSLNKKRLVDLEILDLDSYENLSEEMAQEILEGCYNYFGKRPLKWFNVFEELLNTKSYSYKDGSASHIDLVQWCTIPVWGKIPEIDQENLLNSDENFFQWQFENNDMEIILLGGRQVLDQVKKIPGVALDLIDTQYYLSGTRKIPYEIYKMENFKSRKLIGWSVNLQTMRSSAEEKYGVIEYLKNFLRDEI